MTFIKISPLPSKAKQSTIAVVVLLVSTLFHKSNCFSSYSQFISSSRRLQIPSSLCHHDSTTGSRKSSSSYSSLSSSSITTLKMGLEINIRIVGRKNSIESTSFLQDSYLTYTERLSSSIQLYTTFHKSNNDLLKHLEIDNSKNHGIICLDENGHMYTSEEFSVKVYDWLERFGSRLTFVIGGADGLPSDLKQCQYSKKRGKSNSNDGLCMFPNVEFVSLSRMTFTHQWARTILVEQIYRASEIHKGSGYHKS